MCMSKKERRMKDNDYIAALMSVYAPALSESEATHWFTTQEVFEAVQKIDPGTELTVNDVYDALRDVGFRYQPRTGTIGCDFRWMLKRK